MNKVQTYLLTGLIVAGSLVSACNSPSRQKFEKMQRQEQARLDSIRQARADSIAKAKQKEEKDRQKKQKRTYTPETANATIENIQFVYSFPITEKIDTTRFIEPAEKGNKLVLETKEGNQTWFITYYDHDNSGKLFDCDKDYWVKQTGFGEGNVAGTYLGAQSIETWGEYEVSISCSQNDSTLTPTEKKALAIAEEMRDDKAEEYEENIAELAKYFIGEFEKKIQIPKEYKVRMSEENNQTWINIYKKDELSWVFIDGNENGIIETSENEAAIKGAYNEGGPDIYLKKGVAYMWRSPEFTAGKDELSSAVTAATDKILEEKLQPLLQKAKEQYETKKLETIIR